jgi:hypothetical protein
MQGMSDEWAKSAQPFFSTRWEREDYEREQRGLPPLGPRIAGLSVVVDPSMAPDRIELRNDKGELVGAITNVAKPKRGPPFKPAAERKSVYVGLRLTTASAEWLEAERQRRNLTTLGQVVRQLIAERVERSKLEALSIE